jgi:hypothetical protein
MVDKPGITASGYADTLGAPRRWQICAGQRPIGVLGIAARHPVNGYAGLAATTSQSKYGLAVHSLLSISYSFSITYAQIRYRST